MKQLDDGANQPVAGQSGFMTVTAYKVTRLHPQLVLTLLTMVPFVSLNLGPSFPVVLGMSRQRQ